MTSNLGDAPKRIGSGLATKLLVLLCVVGAAVLGYWLVGGSLSLSDRARRELQLRQFQERHPGRDVNRAILDGEDSGFVKVHVKKRSDRIVGATVVARHAGDLISEIALAMTHGLGLSKVGSTIHPYPTQAEAIRKLGDQFQRTRLTPLAKYLLDKWLTWLR